VADGTAGITLAVSNWSTSLLSASNTAATFSGILVVGTDDDTMASGGAGFDEGVFFRRLRAA
jgi:hypothetical protein